MSFTSLLTSTDQQDYSNANNSSSSKSSLGERRGYGVPKFKSVTPPSIPITSHHHHLHNNNPFNKSGVVDGVFSPSSYFALPHGLNPSELLDSPVLLSAANYILPSPTTGTFSVHAFDWKKQDIKNNNNNNNDNNNFPDFSFQAQTKPQSSSYGQEAWFRQEPSKQQALASSSDKANLEPEFHSNQSFSPEIATIQTHDQNQTIPLNYSPQNNPSSHTIKEPKKLDDGYNWRKYGQKQVKGSENPRSYYKCTHPSCPTKKKVEINLQGHITEIVYKGTHNHPKPQSTRRSSSASSHQSHAITPTIANDDNNNNIPEHSYGSNVTTKTDSLVGTPENSMISIDNDDVEQSSQKRKLGGDELDDEDEHKAKRWKVENESEGVSALGSRTVKEPRVVVQTLSDVDILDDGFRWRKYGQKVVKGNPNPRSYYKCTYQGCNVRKHVERSSQDPRAVINMYEGKHNHDVPAARGSGSNNNSLAKPMPVMQQHNSNNSYPMMATNENTSSSLIESGIMPYGSQYENSLRSRIDSLQGNGGLFLRAKDEARDDAFLDSFLR